MGGAMADSKVNIRSGTQMPDFGSWVEAQQSLRENQGINSSAEDKGLGAEMSLQPLPALTALLTAAM